MPWHLGGPEHLTDAEVEVFIRHLNEKNKREQAELKKSRSHTPRRAPKRGRGR